MLFGKSMHWFLLVGLVSFCFRFCTSGLTKMIFHIKTAGQREQSSVLGSHMRSEAVPYRQWCSVLICLTFPLFLFALGDHEMWLWLQQNTGGVEIFHHLACLTSHQEETSWEWEYLKGFLLKCSNETRGNILQCKRWGPEMFQLEEDHWLKVYG